MKMKRIVLCMLLAVIGGVAACNDNPTANQTECRSGWVADGRGGCAPANLVPVTHPSLDGGVIGGGGGRNDTIPKQQGATSPDSTGV